MKPSLVFFGSFQHYSSKVLKSIVESKAAHISAVITTPPSDQTSKRIENPERNRRGEDPERIKDGEPSRTSRGTTSTYAKSVGLPVFAPTSLEGILPMHVHPKYVNRPDFFIVAGYGKLLPKQWLEYPKIASLNLHFSLLPKYRGANPAEWAILMGERKTGVTLIKMDESIDTGPILMQESLPIQQPTFEGLSLKGGDTRESLYEKLYDLAGHLIVKFLHSPFSILHSAQAQPAQSPTPYAKRSNRQDGYIPWHKVVLAMKTGQEAELIERKARAFAGYPGAWTKVRTTKGEKRLKLLSASIKNQGLILEKVQIEGLKEATFNQIKNQVVTTT